MDKLLNKLPIALLAVQILLLSLLANNKDQDVTIITGMLATSITTAWIIWETSKKNKEDK
jgi:hypothetical protein